MRLSRGFYLLVHLYCVVYIRSEHNKTSGTSTRNAVARESTACPNNCFKQGICLNEPHYSPNGKCHCFPGFYGVDCSLRTCPAGYAWVDLPSATDTAHGFYTECSNMGDCNRETGQCLCRAGFGGPACDRMLCPTGGLSKRDFDEEKEIPCSGNGRCVDLAYAQGYRDYVNFFDSTTYASWDAHMLHGCACDEGWEGIACEKRSCPKGDDPETSGVDEVQLIDCTCTTCSGGIYLTFRGAQTREIPYSASSSLVKARLEELSTLEKASVRIMYGTELCSSGGSTTKIIFELPQGDVPSLEMETYGTLAGTMDVKSSGAWSLVEPHQESIDGTREHAECSNRGNCDYDRGVCECIPGFTSSDGAGNAGSLGDCGHRALSGLTVVEHDAAYENYGNGTILYYNLDGTPVTTTTDCPFVQYVGICSGHGSCRASDNVCECDAGYTGPVCDRKTCGETTMWFGEVKSTANRSATAECGGIGTCDRELGYCVDCGGPYQAFAGSSCERLTCPNTGNGLCNGTGYCRSLREITSMQWLESKEKASYTYSTPWDSDMIYGCSCMRAPSVDNVFSFEYDDTIDALAYLNNQTRSEGDGMQLFYRGPYAFAATDYAGWACANAQCPRGDNPATREGINEIQRVRCIADSGTFTITFRGNTTEVINYDDTAGMLEMKLEQIFTISRVTVKLFEVDQETAVTNALCSANGDTYIFIEFMTESGDLPLIAVTAVDLGLTGGTASLAVIEAFKGTKEDEECSGQGLCNEWTGQCYCTEGYGSSDGTITTAGHRGDCTYHDRWMTSGG